MLFAKLFHSYLNQVVFCLLFLEGVVSAQSDSILLLNEVEVTAQRINLSDVGKHTDKIDSQLIARNHHDHLASMLGSHTPLFVRSYGSGSLATLGIRGGGAAHTQILWNGIPLRNPMIGLLDLSLIPAAFIDEAAIHYGGHGAAFGSGAVGGMISLANDKVDTSNSFHAGIHFGDWGKRSGQIKFNYGLKNIRFSSRLFAQNAENNFRYRINKDLPEKIQVHNQLKNKGFLQEAFFSISEKQTLVGRLWYQDTDRQIPPVTTQTNSKTAQQDKNLRTSLHWNYQGQKVQWQFQSAWLNEINDYQDTLILLYTHNQFKTWMAEGSTSFRLSENMHFTGGTYVEVAEGMSANYINAISRNQTAAFSSIRFVFKHLTARIQAREELTAAIWSPLLFDIAAEWFALKNLTLKTSISRNYRVPTLNDLHWRPGGNPDLIPEEGFTYEAGFHYHKVRNHFKFISSVTGYTRMINEWIMWMPPVKDVSNFWSPINIARVKSEGFELRSLLAVSKAKLDLNLRLGLDLTWSTFETPLVDFNIEAGEQLFYVPVENAFTGITVRISDWTVFYDHHWFGGANGINDALKAFNTGNAGLTYSFSEMRFTGLLFVQLDNAWDATYRVVERRPMPGRTFSTGLKFTFS